MAPLPTKHRPEPSLEELFLAHRPHIERVSRHASRRRGFSAEETEEFVSHVNVKIIEDDYAVLRKFQGKSSLTTYLTVVIERLFLDYLNHKWQKWRPTAEAERLGPLAIQLDRMLNRDGLSLDEVCEILRTNHHVEASLQELHDLARKLPRRPPPRRMEGEEGLENRAAEGLNPEERALSRERWIRREEILGFLQEAMASLPHQEALLVRMRCSGFQVSQIARTLKLEQKPLYRLLQRIYETLRQVLESRGVRPEEISGLLGVPEDNDEPQR